MSEGPLIIRLSAATLAAFDSYVREAERVMKSTLRPTGLFLWCDADPELQKRIRLGAIEAQLWSGTGPAKVPAGLIHDWIGAAFAPDSTVDQVLALVQDYDHHKNVYKPEVVESKLISRDGNAFKIYMRFLKKKIITAVLDTDHDVHYECVGPKRWFCRSHTTRTVEVEQANTPKEYKLPLDTGYGFMWRLNSYWRFEEKTEGVYLECRAISLTRDVPLGLGLLIEPIVRKLPKESLVNTLAATRKALELRKK